MRLGSGLESDVLRVRIGLDEHFLPSGRHEMRLWRWRGSEVSRVRNALRTQFLPLERPKMRLWCVGECDVSRGRLVHKYNFFCFLGCSKCNLSQVVKTMFQVGY